MVFSGGANQTQGLFLWRVLWGGDAGREPFFAARMPTLLQAALASWRPAKGEQPCCKGFILLVTSTPRPGCPFLHLPRETHAAFFYFSLYGPSTKSGRLDSDKLAFNPSSANRGYMTLFCNRLSLRFPSVKCRR